MNIHKNARLTPLRREEMARDVVEGRLSKTSSLQLAPATRQLKIKTPISRLGLTKDNLLRLHS